jgi:tetratricopeptide (TPR) repeat protein
MKRAKASVPFATIALIGTAALAPATAIAGELEDNLRWCIGQTEDSDLRIGACTRLLQSGELATEDVPYVLTMRGYARHSKEEYDRAIEDYTAALRIRPDHFAALNNRGVTWRLKGEYERAIEDFTAALSVEPERHQTFYLRGDVRVRRGEYDEAIEDYTTALRIKPLYPQALKGLAWLLATAPEARLRDGSRSVELAEKAISLKDDAAIRNTLAAAYAEKGRFAEAAALQERAIASARAEELSTEVIAGYEDRLNLYNKRQPYREGPPSSSAPGRGA